MNPNPKKVNRLLRGLKLLLASFLFLLSGNFLNLQADNIPFQVPSAKVKPATSPKIKAGTKKITPKPTVSKKKKLNKVVIKDSVVVEIDPSDSNPPLFEKQ